MDGLVGDNSIMSCVLQHVMCFIACHEGNFGSQSTFRELDLETKYV